MAKWIRNCGWVLLSALVLVGAPIVVLSACEQMEQAGSRPVGPGQQREGLETERGIQARQAQQGSYSPQGGTAAGQMARTEERSAEPRGAAAGAETGHVSIGGTPAEQGTRGRAEGRGTARRMTTPGA